MGILPKPKLYFKPEDRGRYYEAMKACGRTDSQIEAALERMQEYKPMLYLDGMEVNTANFRARDYDVVLGKPPRRKVKTAKRVSDATLMRYVEMAKERGLI